MPNKTTHNHPAPLKDAVIQYGALGLAGTMLLCIPLLITLTLLGAPGGLFVILAVAILMLVPPVVMLTYLSPPVTISADGVTLSPRIWRERFVPWEAVEAVKTYPLMPNEGGEVNRRNFVGRKNYTPPEGIMLVIPTLPLPYRIVAFFAGEPGRGVVALTNRTHTNYPQLVKAITRKLGAVQPHA